MNKFKIGIVVAVIGVMVSSVVFAANLVSEVYFSNFKIKLNGAEYSPEMPVLNYLGRTYLALRELGTVTGNEIDFVNNEIIINNGEKETKQPKHVVQQEVIFNNTKHNLQVQYFYNEEDKTQMPYENVYYEVIPCEKRILLDNKFVISTNELYYIGIIFDDQSYEDIEHDHSISHYVISDIGINSNEQYLVYEHDFTYYIINRNAQLLGCVRDMNYSEGGVAAVLNYDLDYDNPKGHYEMYPEITKDSIQLCYPNCPSDVRWQNFSDIDWYRVKYTIKDGKLNSNIIKFYPADTISILGVS